MDTNKLFKVGRIVVPIMSIAVSAATAYLNNKEFDEKVTKKVSEVLATMNGRES